MEYTKEYLEKIGLIAERAKFAAALLALSFKWDKTQEGKETWMATYEKLYEMAAAGGADMSDMKPPRKGPSAATRDLVDALFESAAQEQTQK